MAGWHIGVPLAHHHTKLDGRKGKLVVRRGRKTHGPLLAGEVAGLPNGERG
jgi:hypothetical protein